MTNSTITLTQEHQVTVPTGKPMMIDTSDWARVRKNVERLGEPLTERASALAAILVGAAVALIGIIVSIEASGTAPKPGLLGGLWTAFGFCTFFALCFFLIGRTEKQRYQVSNRAVCDDMDDLSERAGHEGLGVAAPKPREPLWRRLARWVGGDGQREYI